MTTKILPFDTLLESNTYLLEQITHIANQAIAKKGFFVFILAGGNTPKSFYQALAQSTQDWQHWHFIYGDERFLPIGNSQRNQHLIESTLLKNSAINTENHHIVPYSDNLHTATTLYAQSIAAFIPADVALLGIGEDGHSASLFPDTPASTAIAQAIENAPKPPKQRISLSQQTLSQTNYVFFLAQGEEKQRVISQGATDHSLPFTQIKGSKETTICLVSN